MRKVLSVICLIMLLTPVRAQQMEVVDFARQKRGILWGLLKRQKVTTDKRQAIVDLATGEKGFDFKADGTVAVKADEGDGMLTLKVPHKTRFIVMKHPDYGQLTWKVPKGVLKKKKHYRATLLTYSPDKEYKLQKQWVVFAIEPENAILTVDSTMTAVRNGVAQMLLPIGKHKYRVESPFYSEHEDSVVLTDSMKLTIPVTLQSIYSYVTVRTPMEGCSILVDGKTIGQTVATSGRLMPGRHRVTVFRGPFCLYDSEFTVNETEKKVIELADSDLTPRLVSRKRARRMTLPSASDTTATAGASPLTAFAAPPVSAPVTIEAAGDSTEILIDTEPVGRGTWSGTLEGGFHTLSTRSGGVQSRMQYLWIEDAQPKTVKLLSPLADYGVLNIHSNVVGAAIYLNGRLAGFTPCAVEHVPTDKPCRITLCKSGYRHAKRTVKAVANDMVDVYIKL
jgi:hypothetical protein